MKGSRDPLKEHDDAISTSQTLNSCYILLIFQRLGTHKTISPTTARKQTRIKRADMLKDLFLPLSTANSHFILFSFGFSFHHLHNGRTKLGFSWTYLHGDYLCTSILQHFYCPEMSFSPYDMCLLLSLPIFSKNPQMWNKSYNSSFTDEEIKRIPRVQIYSVEKLRDSKTQVWPVRKTSPKTTRKEADVHRFKGKERHRFWWMQRRRNMREIQSQE